MKQYNYSAVSEMKNSRDIYEQRPKRKSRTSHFISSFINVRSDPISHVSIECEMSVTAVPESAICTDEFAIHPTSSASEESKFSLNPEF